MSAGIKRPIRNRASFQRKLECDVFKASEGPDQLKTFGTGFPGSREPVTILCRPIMRHAMTDQGTASLMPKAVGIEETSVIGSNRLYVEINEISVGA